MASFHIQYTNADAFLSDEPKYGHKTFFIDEIFFQGMLQTK